MVYGICIFLPKSDELTDDEALWPSTSYLYSFLLSISITCLPSLTVCLQAKYNTYLRTLKNHT
jgi:hypothetical protein